MGRWRWGLEGLKLNVFFLPRIVSLTTLCEQAHYCDERVAAVHISGRFLHTESCRCLRTTRKKSWLPDLQTLIHNAQSLNDKRNKQHCFHSWVHLLCFPGVRQSRTLPVWGLLFGFNIITINQSLVTGNDIFQTIFIVIYSLEVILEYIISQESWNNFFWNPMHS